MLVDKETFVPGRTTYQPEIVTIKFTRENLSHDYTKAENCPIFHALKDAGMNVVNVGPMTWNELTGEKWILHRFSRELREASDLLYSTQGDPLGMLWRCWKLEGKEFVVQL